jgi:calpain-7
MLALKEIDLVQDVTADCSVVASLCAAISRSGHAREKVSSPYASSILLSFAEQYKFLETMFYPYDRQKNVPVMSENGRYIFRLHFNGCFRKVVIDDHLPASSDSRTLHVVDRQNPGLLWPALVEKAYLKVRGGYDFPGSNSGTDLWVLTSWIPEQIFLQR